MYDEERRNKISLRGGNIYLSTSQIGILLHTSLDGSRDEEEQEVEKIDRRHLLLIHLSSSSFSFPLDVSY